MKLWTKIEDERMRNAVRNVLRDYRFKLFYIPSSLTGKHHPLDERGTEGLLKHSEKLAWFLYQASIQLQLSIYVRDMLLTAAYFHDLGKLKQTKVIQVLSYPKLERRTEVIREVKRKDLHPILSAKLAREYLEKEGVDPSTIGIITNLIASHMSHWTPYLPQPKTELEKLFALGDFIVSRDEFRLSSHCKLYKLKKWLHLIK